VLSEPAAARKTRAKEEDQGPPPEVGEPVEDHAGEEYKYLWPDHGVAVSFEMLREERGEVKAEISIVTTASVGAGRVGLVEWGSYNLSSDRSRDLMANALAKRTGKHSDVWWQMLKIACYQTVMTFRRGRASVDTRTYEPRPIRWLLPGFVPKGDTSVFYGDGKSTKSLNCLAMMVAAVARRPIGGVYRPTDEVVGGLVIDYETTEDECVGRLRRIYRGAGIDDQPRIIYVPADRNLTAMVPRIREDMHAIRKEAGVRNGHVMILVDSIAWAVGGDVDSAATIPFFNALRGLGPDTTRLVVSHISKAEAAKEKGSTTPYGSIFVKNASRSMHEVRSWIKPNGVHVVGLYHRAINSGPYQGDQAVEVDFHDDESVEYADGTTVQGPITFNKTTVEAAPEIVDGQNAAARLIKALRESQQGAATKTLATMAGVSHIMARKTLNKMRERGAVVPIGEQSDGSGRPQTIWRLPESPAEPPGFTPDDEPPLSDDDHPSDEQGWLPF
jgi:hypothetical protein